MFSMTDEQFNEVKAAKATLINLGYTYHGGEMWKPPLGQPPAYITWEGEGHPPVGALVKYRFSDAERWRYGKVKYITTRNAVLSDETGRAGGKAAAGRRATERYHKHRPEVDARIPAALGGVLVRRPSPVGR